MKSICLALFIVFSFLETQSQQLVFNTPFYEAENHWVAIPKNPMVQKYSLGYIYIDEVAGFTLHFDGYFSVDANGRIYRDPGDKKPINTPTILRFRRNATAVYIIPDNMLESLGLEKEPAWMTSYRHDVSSVQGKITQGKHYNSAGAAQKALGFLESAYQTDPHAPGLEFELTYSYNELRQFDKSIAILKDAIKTNRMSYSTGSWDFHTWAKEIRVEPYKPT
jgi:hypothetical protein